MKSWRFIVSEGNIKNFKYPNNLDTLLKFLKSYLQRKKLNLESFDLWGIINLTKGKHHYG